MVAFAVLDISRRPVQCNARQLLFRAHDDAERGALIQAGCRLREAIRLYLAAECQYHGCLPNEKQQRSARRLLVALQKCEELTEFGAEWLEEALEIGNQLAHCEPVRQGLIFAAISTVHLYLDHAPYLVQPTAAEGRGV